MAIVRSIAGGIVFIIAVITFLLCATGTVGAWIAKATVDEASLAMLATIADYLDLAVEAMDGLDQRVGQTQQIVQGLQRDLSNLRPDLSDRPAVQRAQRVITEEVQPAVEQLILRTQRLRASLVSFNQQIEQLNRMPFVDLPTLPNVLSGLDTQLSQLEAVRSQVQQIMRALETRDPALLQTASAQLDQQLEQISTRLNETQSQITVINAGLNDFSQMMTFWSTISTTAISALLTVFALGQLSLAVHAWGWMRGQPVGRRRR
ncbi:MAG: hypothetical protein AB4911_23420 [Oscillochloridaceae bacterium umkhey_bin13]